MKKICIIGAGEMGGAFALGLLNGNCFDNGDIIVSNPHVEKLEKFARLGAQITTDNSVAADSADYVALVVKPDAVKQVIEEIKPMLDYDHQTIINMAASVSIKQLRKWFEQDGKVPNIFQVLPNIGIAERASMSFIVPDVQAAGQLEKVKKIFDDLGETIVTDENLLAAGTALAGCGIAYVLRYVRAATEAGVELGFKPQTAAGIITQTMKGAVALLKANEEHPEAEIDRVTTPGGLTIKGLNVMEQNGFTNAVIQGIKAGMK